MTAEVIFEYESESGEVFDLWCFLESDIAELVKATPDGPHHKEFVVWELIEIRHMVTRKRIEHLFSKTERERIEKIATDLIEAPGSNI